MSQITISPSGAQFTAEEGETILDAAIRQGHNLPNGCQSGVCGTCAAQLVSGEIEAGDYDDCALSAEDAAAGKILTCCSRAQSDIVLDIPAYQGCEVIPARTTPARVAGIELRGDVAVLRLALPKSPPFKFYAGQYMDFLLAQNKTRSYSIASAPAQADVLEFHIRRREGGLFSEPLFSGSLKEGSILRLRGPKGSFALCGKGEKPMIFLATGTGFAPVKSQLAYLSDTDPARPVHVYCGARTQSGLYDEAALHEILGSLKNARYTPVLSRPEEGWTGATGYLAEHVLRDYPDLSGSEVYACGLPAMISESKKILCGRAGLPETSFYSDAFTTAQ